MAIPHLPQHTELPAWCSGSLTWHWPQEHEPGVPALISGRLQPTSLNFPKEQQNPCWKPAERRERQKERGDELAVPD